MKSYAITPKGQVTIPVSLREELKLKPGDKVIYEKSSGGILLKPAKKNMLDDFGFMKNIDSQKANINDIRKAVRNKIARKRS
ncbi:MAG: AbrB/MazE/SpoVT family DNA-binding domain-containing protein [Deltaproteobacteria bacterium]|jgi:antitoxin PrlF|nr:AbrB/MazE/SpoVT family DNA-binding domain-containing protein [Deltaproteobacteria bacterium]MBT4266860.1 AbrB/MazE/SpoVT family DNA-binding domain-containing protein [Deltaproteobacteria bacterium]MBT4640825.1 AbrB/MazE/SpoVT family DNA-binding domain-containing protein [Deltaproteobacteria bacterium]MBT6502346.1 AbrB/MazE/SpoVT family DNA-binding domain-containing protein [Deltaproteobacteria bacterium]MBT6614400.1 AbrB/MazE/SpoVT family DNA-binding domain-containing protein [Deltaproteobac